MHSVFWSGGARVRATVTAVVGVAVAGFVSGCQPVPADATYNLPSRDDLYDADLVLSEDEREEILSIMRATVPSDEPTVMSTARYGVRWHDVDAAVRWGSSVIEMAVLSAVHTPAKRAAGAAATSAAGASAPYTGEASGGAIVEPERWTYEIITAADEPVTLTITREPPPTVYSATAVAGLFGNRRDVEERLLDEVHASMRLFGAKRLPTALDEP